MATNPTKPALDIEQLKKRHKELEKQKTTAEANLKTANEQLESLKEEAREKYGTDDLDKLKELLKKMKEENERKRGEYQGHLEQIDAKLLDVEKQFAVEGKAE